MQRQQNTGEINTTEKSESRGSLSEEITMAGFSSSLKFLMHYGYISHEKYQIRVRCSMSSPSNMQTSHTWRPKNVIQTNPRTQFSQMWRKRSCSLSRRRLCQVSPLWLYLSFLSCLLESSPLPSQSTRDKRGSGRAKNSCGNHGKRQQFWEDLAWPWQHRHRLSIKVWPQLMVGDQPTITLAQNRAI